jgi:hypothetical protein
MFKIYTTFETMKKGSNIFLKFLLFTVVFFCTGINIHSGIETKQYNTELSTNTENIEICLTPDIDLSDEDQMEQSHISGLSEQPNGQKSDLIPLPFISSLFISIWQPPKIF